MANRKGINAGVVFALAMSVLAFVILGVIVSVGAGIQTGIMQTQCNSSVAGGGYNSATNLCFANSTTSASNITVQAQNGIQNTGNQLPLMGTIIVFSAVIALLLAVFAVRGKGM